MSPRHEEALAHGMAIGLALAVWPCVWALAEICAWACSPEGVCW